MIRRLFAFVLVGLVATINTHPARAAVRTVALANNNFGQPVLNDQGQVAFIGSLDNPDGSGFVEGIWSEGTGTLRLVAGRGGPVPNFSSGARFLQFHSFGFNNNGRVAFRAALEDGAGGVNTPHTTGIWSEGHGPLKLIAFDNNQAPGFSSTARYSFFFTPVLSDSGDIAFASSLDRNVVGQSDTAIFSTASGTLGVVALSDGSAPGVPGRFADTLNFIDPLINDSGRLAFAANLRVGGSVTNSNSQGIWSDRTGILQLVARKGDPASGFPVGVNYSSMDAPILNAAGQIIFSASMSTGIGGVTNANNAGFVSDRGGAMAFVLREGDPLPSGSAAESVHLELFSDPVLNHAGRFAFAGRIQLDAGGLATNRDSAIWAERELDLELIAREGDQAPGTPAGAVFDDLATTSFVFNARGQVAFLGQLKSGLGGVTLNDRAGIWATDLLGQLHLIARQGDLLEVAPGDFREIRELIFAAGTGTSSTGNEDGRPSGFNERGQVAFSAIFTDFTGGVFVSSLVVPEPTTLSLLVCFVVANVSRPAGSRRRP